VSEIHYVTGDATQPVRREGEHVAIAHVVNDEGRWGRGFVVALTNWDDGPERAYRRWHRLGTDPHAGDFQLGAAQLVPFGPGAGRLWVANLVAQRGWRRGGDDPQALDPEALKQSLRVLHTKVSGHFGRFAARVVMPRIGCGLGGAQWSDVAPIIQEELVDRGVDVTVYSLPGQWEEEK
jgi:O-acetyl-ADP-ribose deacetylase (regulator of RNase III)